MTGAKDLSTCWSVSKMMDPAQENPANEETTQDIMLSFPYKIALARCKRTTLAEQADPNCYYTWPHHGVSRRDSSC